MGESRAPPECTLDKLRLSFENNLYAIHPGQGLFYWGCVWSRHKKYATVEDVRNDLTRGAGLVVSDRRG